MQVDLVGDDMRVVIPSVQYGDYLADTLPAWQKTLPRSARIVVVTSDADHVTQAVASQHGADVCVTNIWSRDGAKLNMGAALDEAFGFTDSWTTPPSEREACLSINADLYPVGPFPDRRDLRTWRLYGAARRRCETRADLIQFQHGHRRLEDFPVILQRQRKREPGDGDESAALRSARACLGYFQLFRYRPGLTFGASKSAGGYDLVFRRHFQQRVALTKFSVLHLGLLDRRNWRGRVVPVWSQDGVTAV